MSNRILLAIFACWITSTSFADAPPSIAASDAQLTTDNYVLSGTRFQTQTDGDIASILISGDAQMRWQRGKWAGVELTSDQMTLKAKTSLSSPSQTVTVDSATCVGDCKISTQIIRCTCERIEIRSGTTDRMVLSGNVKLTIGDTTLRSASCTMQFSGDSPSIIGEFLVPEEGWGITERN